MSGPGVWIRTLGSVELQVRADLLPLSTLHRRLLAALAIHAGRTVTTERLVFALWGDDAPRSSVNRIQALVSDIRRRLSGAGVGAEVIETTGPGYRLRTDRVVLDSLRFGELVGAAADFVRMGVPDQAAEAYRQALELWRGTAFDGAGLFDHDLPAVSAGLEAARARAFEDQVQLRLDLGESDALVPELVAAVERDPLRESLRGHLMLALTRAGRAAEALDVYQQGARLLAADLGVEPGPQLQRLCRSVMAGDPTILTPAGADVPRMLPPNPARLSGRDAELAMVQRALTGEGSSARAAVVALHGAGGVGKSALAIAAAHGCRDQFPDGQIYADLQGSTPGLVALAPAEVIARVLRALGVPPERLPAADDEAAGVLRSRLAGKRVLILADNAAAATQVLGVIPAEPQCAVIVTSRGALSSLDAVHIAVTPLAPEAAETLLRELVGADRTSRHPADVAAVARACSYLPLAIRIAAGRMMVRPDWTLAELAERMADRPSALRELTSTDDRLRVSFVVSWQELGTGDATDELAIRIFLLFGGVLLPDLTLDLIGALLDVEVADARAGVDRLIELHLLEAVGGRYRPHDVLRLFAAELASESSEQSHRQLARALRWYEGGARQATEMTGRPVWHQTAHPDPAAARPVLADNQQAGRWLDAERANLLAVVQQGVKEAAPLPELSADLAVALYPGFIMRNHNREFELICQAVLDTAGGQIAATTAARICTDLGMLLRMQGRHDEALDKLTEALALNREEDLNGRSRTLGVIAHVHVGRGDPHAALPLFDEALRMRRETGDLVGESSTLSNAAEAYHLTGRSDVALELLERSLEIRHATDDLVGEAITNENMAEVYLELKRPQDARAHADAAIACARRCDAREVQRRALTLRARIWLAIGDRAAAGADRDEGLALAATSRATNLADLRELASAFRAAGDADAAVHIEDQLATITHSWD